MTSLLETFRKTSALSGTNAAFIEDLYESYLQDPESVGEVWRSYFDDLTADIRGKVSETAHSSIRKSFALMAKQKSHAPSQRDCMAPEAAQKQASVLRVINSFRVRGHQKADTDPLNLLEKDIISDLELGYHGLGELDMDLVFNTGSLFAPDRLPFREIYSILQTVYGGTIGSEFMHIVDTQEKRWIQKRLETTKATPSFDAGQKKWILQMLTGAEGIEKYLHNKYVGQKRFSLEGGESLIPMLDQLIQNSGEHGIKEVVVGMAHRGRLNVLINILGKAPSLLFDEFEGKHRFITSGDVKYHQGFSADIDTKGGALHLVLAFNPSHLEIVDPVVQGSVRARQQRRGHLKGRQVIPVLIHGDASFAGQGVIMETLNMSQARGYRTGGTVHIVINNQIGFTTSNPLDARSTAYCTEVAKMVQAPIFHVNGDDPEAVVFITQIALDYCMEFNKDVIVDMVCYRRHGHNEADEPAMTQPVMYRKIREKETTRTLYAERLVAEGVITVEDAQQMVTGYRDTLEHGEPVSRGVLNDVKIEHIIDWSPYLDRKWDEVVPTNLSIDELQHLSERLVDIPDGFEVHPRVIKLLDDRRKMVAGALPMDWGCAETLAYASLVKDGHKVRLSGQDSGRGTFSHRHSVLHHQKNGDLYTPLQHISADQGHFTVIDSLLSEEAVLGFEYGFSTADPSTLTIWEAQFGDFANGAQVVIDQFISSGEVKWGRLCGLVMLLPHGYEGQGPEHSSARLERYMQLCAEFNMQICVPTTPAQVFHMLRRQIIRQYRKPLVVMSGKSLLRNKLCVSKLEDLSKGKFEPVIGETEPLNQKKIKRLIFCSGKVYYDLFLKRKELGVDVAIARLEQVYPFPDVLFDAEIKRYPKLEEIVWCQEEPQNQGVWDQIKHRFKCYIDLGINLCYTGRPTSASPAVGMFALHVEQQEKLVLEALTGTLEYYLCQRK